MAPLTKDRNTPELMPGSSISDVAAGAVIYIGAMLMRGSTGNLLPGATATGLIGVGVAREHVNNTGGLAAEKTALYSAGVFRFVNSTGGDALTKADIGAVCYAVDDQTVAATDGTGTRSPAGCVQSVDDAGVWVRFDETLTALAVAANA